MVLPAMHNAQQYGLARSSNCQSTGFLAIQVRGMPWLPTGAYLAECLVREEHLVQAAALALAVLAALQGLAARGYLAHTQAFQGERQLQTTGRERESIRRAVRRTTACRAPWLSAIASGGVY